MITRMLNIFSKKIWALIGGVVLIIGLITGIFTIDDRYAKGSDLSKLEKESVKTFQSFQQVQTQELKGIKATQKLQYLQLQYELIQSKLSSLRLKLANDKTNKILITEYDNLLDKEAKLKTHIDETLTK